ncbi:unnamed protein product [Polarella glacialis]|uniref:Uncharacterized protein n=1 Tax=Polarella glacialis TaxID=89957 RepID=A0A813JHY8_POLGL|nr:unnamed protein product [Polarella glacialis]
MAGPRAEAPPKTASSAHRWPAAISSSASREQSRTPPKRRCPSKAFRTASEKDVAIPTSSTGDGRQPAFMLEAEGEVVCVIDVTETRWAAGLLPYAKQAVNSVAVDFPPYELVPEDEWPKLCQQLPPPPFARPGGNVQFWQCQVDLPCGHRLRGLSLAFKRTTAERGAALAALVLGQASGLLRKALCGLEDSGMEAFARIVAEVPKFSTPAVRQRTHHLEKMIEVRHLGMSIPASPAPERGHKAL